MNNNNTAMIKKINLKHQFMSHTSDCGTRLLWTNDIAVFLNTAA